MFIYLYNELLLVTCELKFAAAVIKRLLTGGHVIVGVSLYYCCSPMRWLLL